MKIKIQKTLQRLERSTCNFLAVDTIKRELRDAGFTELKQEDEWQLHSAGKYFMVKNGSAIFAFVKGSGRPGEHGFRIIAAHSDSPCFKIKPNAEIYGDGGVVSLNVEKYGGGILYTWFDRPLSMSGRVMLATRNPLRPETRLFDLERGVKGSTAEHLSVAEFKLKKTEEQLAEIENQISEVEGVDEIKSANLPLNKVAINKSDYENLISTAKHYVSARKAEEENFSLRAENLTLKNKNEELRSENSRISDQLHTLEYKFDEFYSSVEDEVALRDENAKLKSENARIGNQVHALTAEIFTLKEERKMLTEELMEQQNAVAVLNTELKKSRSMFQALQEKFDKVMRFIESLNLKQRLEKILKPYERKR